MPLPKVGEIVDGYSYSGGDPNSQKSWKWVGDGSQAAAQLQGDAPGEPPVGALTFRSEAQANSVLGRVVGYIHLHGSLSKCTGRAWAGEAQTGRG